MPFVPDSPTPPTPGFKPDSAPAQEPSLLSKVGGGISKVLGARDAFNNAMVKGATFGTVDPSKFNEYSAKETQDNPLPDTLGKMYGGLAPTAAIAAVAPEGAGLVPALTRTGLNTGVSAAEGAITHPEDRLGGALKQGGLALLLSGAGELAGAGLGKSADWLQQKAMGMKKYFSGAGSDAIDQGIRGTRDAMSGQMADSISDISGQIGSKLSSASPVDSADAAKPLQTYLQSLQVGEGVPGHSLAEASAVGDRAAEVAARGEVPAQTAWDYAKAAGGAGYRNQKALASDAAKLAQLEQQGYSSAVKDAYTKANPGDSSVSDSFDTLSNLFKGQQGLNQQATLRQGIPMSTMFASGAGGAAMGAAASPGDRVKGGILGALLGTAARSPVVQSYGAKGLDLAGKAAQDPAIRQLLLNGIFGAGKE